MLQNFPCCSHAGNVAALYHGLLCRGVVSLAFLPKQQQDGSLQQLTACTRGGTVSIYKCCKADGEDLNCSSSASFSVPKPVHSMVSTCLTCTHCLLPSVVQLF